MKTNEDVRNALLEAYDEDMANNIVFFESPDYADAVIGTCEENSVVRLIYSYEKMVDCLVRRDGMTEEEAAEFIDYNVIRALPYFKNAPIVMYDMFL